MVAWNYRSSVRIPAAVDEQPRRRRRPSRSEMLAVCLIASTLALAAPATAANIVEVQLEATRVLALITAEASHERCFTPFTLDESPTLYVIDHVEFPGGAALRRRPGDPIGVVVRPAITVQTKPLQAVVPVTLFVKTLTCAENPQCAPEQTVAVDLGLVFALSASSGKLCVSLADIEPPGIVPEDKEDELKASVGTICMEGSPTDSMAPLLKDHVLTGDGGVSADAALTRVAFRAEYDNSSTLAEWDSFFNAGAIAPAAPQKDWSVFVDATFLQSIIVDQIMAGMSEMDDVSLGEPASYWWPLSWPLMVNWYFPPLVQQYWPELIPDPSWPGMAVIVPGDKDVDDCPIDLGFEATLFGGFALGNEALLLHFDVDVDGNFADLLGCTLLGPNPKNSLVQLLVSFIVQAVNASDDGDIPTDSLPPECTSNGSDSIDCSFPISLPAGFSVDTVTGNASGLVIAGTVPVTPAPGPISTPDISVAPITYGVHGGCGNLHIGFEGKASVSGPGRFCDAYFANASDPMQLFWVETPPMMTALPENLTLQFSDGIDSPYFEPGEAYSPHPGGDDDPRRSRRRDPEGSGTHGRRTAGGPPGVDHSEGELHGVGAGARDRGLHPELGRSGLGIAWLDRRYRLPRRPCRGRSGQPVGYPRPAAPGKTRDRWERSIGAAGTGGHPVRHRERRRGPSRFLHRAGRDPADARPGGTAATLGRGGAGGGARRNGHGTDRSRRSARLDRGCLILARAGAELPQAPGRARSGVRLAASTDEGTPSQGGPRSPPSDARNLGHSAAARESATPDSADCGRCRAPCAAAGMGRGGRAGRCSRR